MLSVPDSLSATEQSILISSVASNTSMFVTPDYRGVNTSQGVKVCAVVDKKAKQTEFNRDKLDGNGKNLKANVPICNICVHTR